MVRMRPVVRATEDPPRSAPTSRHLTSPLTVPCDQGRRRYAWRSPPTRSHGGSQGFKSPHLHPQHCRSERRQPRAGDAYCILRPRRGRKLTSQCSRKAPRDQATRPKASHNDHAAWPPPAADRRATLAQPALSRSTTRAKRPLLNHTHDDDQVETDPPLAQDGLG